MLFRLDFQSAVPIYRQIRDQVVLAVAQGGADPRRAAAHHPGTGGGRGRQCNDREQGLPAAQGRGISRHRPPGRGRRPRPAGQGSGPVCRPDRPAETAGGRGTAGRADPGRFCGGLQSRLWRNGGLNDGDHEWIYAVDLLALRGRQLHHAAQYEQAPERAVAGRHPAPGGRRPARGAGHCKTISNAAGHLLSGLRRAQCAAGLCAGDRHCADTLDALLFLPGWPCLTCPCCRPTQRSRH